MPGWSVHVAVSVREGRAVPVTVDLGWRQGRFLSTPTPPQAIFLYVSVNLGFGIHLPT